MRIGEPDVPAALIFEPRRKISADTLVGPPVPALGGFLPTTRAPGWIVTVMFGCTKVRPSTSTRQPVSQIWFEPIVPLTVARVVQLSPPDPLPAFGAQIVVPEPWHSPKSVGLPARNDCSDTTSAPVTFPGGSFACLLTWPHDALPAPPQSAALGAKTAFWRRIASAIVSEPSPFRAPHAAAAPACRAEPATSATAAAVAR